MRANRVHLNAASAVMMGVEGGGFPGYGTGSNKDKQAIAASVSALLMKLVAENTGEAVLKETSIATIDECDVDDLEELVRFLLETRPEGTSTQLCPVAPPDNREGHG